MTTPLLTTENASSIFGDIPRPPTVPEFKFLNEIPKGNGESFLIYGPSGSGKTRLLGTCGDRALIISNGAGETTLKSPMFEKQIGSNPIIVQLYEKIGPRGMFDDAVVHDAICDTIDYALEKFPEKFDFICIDDGTQLRRGAMYKGLEINQKTNKSKTLTDVVEKYDVVAAAVQDYQMEMNIIESFVASYVSIAKEAGKHFVLCAHERLTYKKSEKIGDTPVLIRTSPAFTGVDKNPSGISGYFDNVWYTEVVGGGSNRVWRVTTKGHEQLNAKTRMDGVFETVEMVRPDDMFLLNCVKRIRESSPDKVKAKK